MKCTIVFSLILVGQFANPMLLIIFEITLVFIPVGKDVLALALPDAINVVTIVLVPIGVHCVAPACVISGRFACYFLPFFGKLERDSSLLFGHVLL